MKKMSKKKIIILVVVVLLCAFIAFIVLRPKQGAVKIVKAYSLQKGTVEKIVDVQGNLEAEDSAELTSPYNYEVLDITVKEGDKVEKDQVLATLDGKELQDEITLLEKEVRVDELRIQEGYDSAKDVYQSTDSLVLAKDSAKINLDSAQETLQKQKELFEAGAVSQQALEDVQNEKEQAQIAYDQASESLTKAEHEIKVSVDNATPKQSAMESLELKKTSLQQKKNKLEDLKIKSPIKGTVTRVYAKKGRNAKDTENNQPMFIIEDESKKYVVAKIGEYDISNIKLGQNARITADVLGSDEVKGIVNRISPTGEHAQSSASNSIVVPIRILVTQSDERLITGVTAKVKIETDKVNNVYKVPFESLLYSKEEGDYFYAIEKGSLKKIKVKKGLESDLEVEISSPELKEGMLLVQNPEEELTEGEKVKIEESGNKKRGTSTENKEGKSAESQNT